MRAMQRQVANVWLATIETDTSLSQCHGVIAEAEVVSISTAFAVAAARVLDLVVLQEEHGDAYLEAKRTERLGRVVDGLVLIRNAELHLPAILDPDSDRVLSFYDPEMGQIFRVIPKWRPYAELPTEIQNNDKTSQRCHDAYQAAVEGESVIETLLDALAWFLACDPSLGRRDASGELEHFPLPELWQHDYERRHPEWPRRSEIEDELREVAATRTPEGRFRAIRHRLNDVDGATLAYCGFARTNSGGSAFSEFPDQVKRDVRAGYAYYLEAENGTYLKADVNGAPRVTLHEDVLVVDGRPLADVALSPFDDEDPGESTWRAWFDLVSHDAFKYVEQRKAAGG
jgi:hypothetical protein